MNGKKYKISLSCSCFNLFGLIFDLSLDHVILEFTFLILLEYFIENGSSTGNLSFNLRTISHQGLFTFLSLEFELINKHFLLILPFIIHHKIVLLQFLVFFVLSFIQDIIIRLIFLVQLDFDSIEGLKFTLLDTYFPFNQLMPF